ncbi:hypothetical protein [Pseudoalteromonas rhizosphaerae]|uniref:Uncharacterized protein n=1 Tax=Pseudoalteromonas rhizosphaerae TaxID=2518973 RepID=A0ABW8L0U7_9GAMM
MNLIVAIGFLVGGLVVIFTPTKILLRNDYGAGKLFYKLEKNEDDGLKYARRFYNKLGGALVFVGVFGIFFTVVSW